MSVFTAGNWYWFVGGTGPHKASEQDPFTGDESRVYSSARLSYVPSSDPSYLEWKKFVGLQCGLSDPTTRIDTEENLRDALKIHGIDAVFVDATE